MQKIDSFFTKIYDKLSLFAGYAAQPVRAYKEAERGAFLISSVIPAAAYLFFALGVAICKLFNGNSTGAVSVLIFGAIGLVTGVAVSCASAFLLRLFERWIRLYCGKSKKDPGYSEYTTLLASTNFTFAFSAVAGFIVLIVQSACSDSAPLVAGSLSVLLQTAMFARLIAVITKKRCVLSACCVFLVGVINAAAMSLFFFLNI